MRTLVISAFAALLFSTSLALAQGSGAAGDIGSGSVRAGQGGATVGQGQGMTNPAAAPAQPGPKAAKKTAAKKKKGAE